MSTMNICGIDLEFEFLDADELQRYLDANEAALKRINDKSEYEGKSTPDQMRTQCAIINEFFDSVFGDGTSEKLFHGKNNLGDHMEAFGIMSEAAQKSDSRLTEIGQKYNPNRAQRRFEQRQHNGAQQRQFQAQHAGGRGGNK